MKISAKNISVKTVVSAVGHRKRLATQTALATCLASGLVIMPTQVAAQSATPGAKANDEIIVIGERNVLQERIDALPGGAVLVQVDDIPSTANSTLSRALASVPGIIVQDFFGGNDQPRIQIRGSGLQQNPVERGTLILQDGLPINRADGSYVVGLANPAQAQAIEVYRGYLANRLGASVQGGAINFISPTGRSAPGGKLALSGGSFGQISALGQYGLAGDGYDILIQADISERDGYRDYNDSRRTSFGANLGIDLSEAISIRFFGDYTDLGFEVTGPLTAPLAETNPTSIFGGPTFTPTGILNPGPNVVRDQPRRDSQQWLIGSRATGTFGDHTVDLALGYTSTDDVFRFPIAGGTREVRGDDLSTVLRYSYKPNGETVLPLFEATAQYVTGSADRDYYLNLSGVNGAQFGASELGADTLSLNVGFHIPVGSLTLSPSLAFARANRDNNDVFVAPTRPTGAYNPGNPTMALPGGMVPTVSSSYARNYEGWSPALGLSWNAGDDQTLFAAISRSFEPPTHDDLLATVNGTPFSSAGRPNPGNPILPAGVFATPDLDAQRATTLEAGWRGNAGVFGWDATAYYSWVENELLSLRDDSGVSLSAINADRTRHFGIELGLSAQVSDSFSSRITYNYQDFSFHNDPVRGNNQLAGAPRHSLHASADYRVISDWSVGASLRWMMERTPVDNLNTVYRDAYAVVDLRTDFQISDQFSVFGEVTNLFDVTYASSTLIVDQARPDLAAFLPGDGRGFFAGIMLSF